VRVRVRVRVWVRMSEGEDIKKRFSPSPSSTLYNQDRVHENRNNQESDHSLGERGLCTHPFCRSTGRAICSVWTEKMQTIQR
jgi:hypothetical protein